MSNKPSVLDNTVPDPTVPSEGTPAVVTIPETAPKKKRNRVGMSIGRKTLITLAKAGGIEGKPGNFSLTVVTGEGISSLPVASFVGINDSFDLTLTRELYPDQRDKVALRIALTKAMSSGKTMEQVLAELMNDTDEGDELNETEGTETQDQANTENEEN